MLEALFDGDDDTWQVAKPNAFLASITTMLERGNLLCLGENEGQSAVFLAKMGHTVRIVDPTTTGIEHSEALARDHRVNLETLHAHPLEFDMGENSYSSIVALFCHLVPAKRRVLHQRVTRALRPGGLLVLEAYREEQLTLGPCGFDRLELLVSRDAILSELACLDLIRVGQVERIFDEEPRRTGRGCVLDVIARKRHVHNPCGPIN